MTKFKDTTISQWSRLAGKLIMVDGKPYRITSAVRRTGLAGRHWHALLVRDDGHHSYLCPDWLNLYPGDVVALASDETTKNWKVTK